VAKRFVFWDVENVWLMVRQYKRIVVVVVVVVGVGVVVVVGVVVGVILRTTVTGA